MKKRFTVDDFVIALATALGFGFGFDVPKFLGYPMWLCVVSCLVVGCALEALGQKIVFSEAVQKIPARRYAVLAVIILVSLVAQHLATSFMGKTMLNYVEDQYNYLILLALGTFAFHKIIRWYRIRKIRERYGTGRSGFVFDGAFSKEKLAEENKQNQPIRGEFDKDCAVKTKTGVFVGMNENASLCFYGIPYAKPPVGELRWKAPEPLPESNEVFEAKYFGASAIQVDYDGSFLKNHRQSEDCLTLNILTESKTTKKKKSVLVIFHHGDFSYGGSASPLLYSEDWKKIYPETVIVTVNYRLGILGFIDFTDIPGGEAYPDALNLSLLDQIAALRWIKENISAFGGDPKQITVMGFESGALSIWLLAASEQAKGLFRKAFMFFGNPIAAYDTPEVSRTLVKKLLQETSSKTMADLLRLSSEQLKEVSQKLALDFSGPICDGKLIPMDVYAAYQSGSVSGVEFIVGIPRNEAPVYKSFVGAQKYGDVISKELAYILRYLEGAHSAGAKAVKAYIEAQLATESDLEAKAKFLEQVYTLSTYFSAKKLTEGGGKVHLFYWNAKPLIKNLGSGTVDVIATFLGNVKAVQMYGTILNADIVEPLQNLFRKFVSGDKLQLFLNEIKGMGAIDWEPLYMILADGDIVGKKEEIPYPQKQIPLNKNAFVQLNEVNEEKKEEIELDK